MKLLFVIDWLGAGGAQRQMVSLAMGLHARGHQVEFFCYVDDEFLAGPLHQAAIPVHIYPKHSRYSLDVFIALRRLLRAERYNLVLAFMPIPTVYAAVSARLLRRRPLVVASERAYDPPEGAARAQGRRDRVRGHAPRGKAARGAGLPG